MKILKIHLRIFVIAINSLFSNEDEFCLRVKVCILKDFRIYAFSVKAAELEENEAKSSKLKPCFVRLFSFCRGGLAGYI